MSFNPEQLQEHCEIILKSTEIRNKIVVLCEGTIPEIGGRKSVQSYKEMKHRPDANFYMDCIPKWWSQKRPRFINCGDRKDVLDTYFTLPILHEKDTTNSNLYPEQLFAMIDLDLQLQRIDNNNYPFKDTEEIFLDLYEKSEVKAQNAKLHRIWITGLIHKEAYFLTPELQSIFDDYPHPPMYQDNPVELNSIYMDMADKISSDPDLKNNLNIQRALDRINHCLNCTDLDTALCVTKRYSNSSEQNNFRFA